MVVNPETTVRKLVSISREMAQRIDDYRFDNRIGSESQAIRQIIEAGLEAIEARQSRAPKRRGS